MNLKNQIIRNSTILVIVLLAITSSCHKNTVTLTRAQLMARDWLQTDLLASIGGAAPVSVFTTVVDACQRDNIWQFKSDGTYTVVEGATKCHSTDPDIVTTGTWQLTENDTKVVIDDINNAPQTFTITEITTTSLKINGNVTIQGNLVNATAIFQAH